MSRGGGRAENGPERLARGATARVGTRAGDRDRTRDGAGIGRLGLGQDASRRQGAHA